MAEAVPFDPEAYAVVLEPSVVGLRADWDDAAARFETAFLVPWKAVEELDRSEPGGSAIASVSWRLVRYSAVQDAGEDVLLFADSVNGRIHGFEIKSDADTLDRLPAQVEGYGRVLDRVTLVTGSRHADAARRLVPRWWGLYVAQQDKTGRVRFRVARRERANPGLDLHAVAALLWRDEALALLEKRGRARGLRSKPRRDLCRALVESVAPDALRRDVRVALRSRTGWRAA